MITRDEDMLRALRMYDDVKFKVTPVLPLDKKPALKIFLKSLARTLK